MNTSKLSTVTAATKAVAQKIAKRGMHGLMCAAGALFAVGALNANAQATLTWDISTAAGITGGTGPWNTTDTKWTIDAGTNNIAWINVAGTPKDNAIFGGTAGTVTLGEPISLKNLTINTANYIITGSTLNFTGGNITSPVVATISSAITGSPTVTASLAANAKLTFAPTAGSVTLGAITGAAGPEIVLAGSTTGNSLASDTTGKLRMSSGTWTLTGEAYAYEHWLDGGNLIISTGTIRHNNRAINLIGGTLHYNNPAAVRADGVSTGGDSSFRLRGGSLDNTRGSAITTSTYNPQMNFAADWTFLGSQGTNSDLYLGNGSVHLSSGIRQVTVSNADTTLALGGVLNSGGLTKAGAGTLELRGVNTYTMATTVKAGKLLIKSPGSLNASSAVVVAGGTLAGNGTINGPVTVGNLGSIAPGTPTAQTGTLTINNNCTITNNLNITVNGTLSSKLVVTNALTIISGATINVTEVAPPPAGALVIATYNTLVGTFATVNSATSMVVDHNYQGLNQIALIVPPSGTVILFH